VLNNTEQQTISTPTRARVLQAAANLGYVPSAAARTLRLGRSGMVVGLLPDWPIGPALGAFAQELTIALAERNLTFLLHPKAAPDRPLVEVFKAVAPAAVLLFDSRDWSGLDAVDVVIELPLGMPQMPPGAPDRDPSGGVGKAQVDHLVGRGHRRLGFARPDDPRLTGFAESRLASVRNSCKTHRLTAPMVRRVSLTPRGGVQALKAWCAKDVTAVCAYNDEVALAVLAGMHALQLRAPRDLAVIGVDDIPAAALAAPALTTIGFDIGRCAQHLAELIACRIDRRPDPPEPPPGGLRVIHREST